MFSCPICRNGYNTFQFVPKCLPCGHTICQICIYQTFLKSRIVVCQICNSKFKTNNDNLPINFEVLNIMDELSKIFANLFSENSIENSMKQFSIQEKKIGGFSEEKPVQLEEEFTKTSDMCVVDGCYNSKTIRFGQVYPYCSDECGQKSQSYPERGVNSSTNSKQFRDTFSDQKFNKASPQKIHTFGQRTPLSRSPSHSRIKSQSSFPQDRIPFKGLDSGSNTPKNLSKCPSLAFIDGEQKCVIPSCENKKHKYGDLISPFCGQRCWNRWPDYPNGQPRV